MLIRKVSKNDKSLISLTKSQLSNLRNYYTGFNDWFDNKVVPNIDTTRNVFVAMDGDDFAGALILKNDSEKKICTLFVKENNRFNHIGGDFLSIASKTLKTNDLPISVSDSVKECFFNGKNFNFILEKEQQNAYKQGATEYFGYIRYHENNKLIQFAKMYGNGFWHLAVIVEKRKETKKLLDIYKKEGVELFDLGNNVCVSQGKLL